MCFKYEEEYDGSCWDFMLFLDYGIEKDLSIKNLLRDEYGVQITDHRKFDTAVFDLFERMHEEGVIEPKPYAVKKGD